ncbi:toxin [Staphylococcus condimenti]|uniref:ImmA/IrrE family metallo-endopeptidase n=1 Tax=Staphylococcus condimenti TaxID=70255 RepID=UPI000947804C|nr:ImmA/IrrE family metallo-endopeptidase [Staphylococcus condimenti]APR61458.1 toxin [Staphylococcus condimenti]MDK8645259.1 ImmA/IrrE family metallo-endopeptidase [Staphylococcus condimenti]
MSNYERLMINHENIAIEDKFELPGKFKGFYTDGVILIDKYLSYTERNEVLAEEIAHSKITYGNIINESEIFNRKLELRAQRLGTEMIVTLKGIIEAFKIGIYNLFELAEHFEVSEGYVLDALQHYKMKFGLSTYYNGYIISFEPLQVFKYIDKTE